VWARCTLRCAACAVLGLERHFTGGPSTQYELLRSCSCRRRLPMLLVVLSRTTRMTPPRCWNASPSLSRRPSFRATRRTIHVVTAPWAPLHYRRARVDNPELPDVRHQRSTWRRVVVQDQRRCHLIRKALRDLPDGKLELQIQRTLSQVSRPTRRAHSCRGIIKLR